METNSIKFTRHVYTRISGTDWNNEYQLIKNSIQKAILPEIIRIEPNRGFNVSKNIDNWLCVYNCPDWQYKNRVTGLRKTYINNVFEGNLIDPTRKELTPGSLIFFEFSANDELLVIDVFKDFYTHEPFTFRLLIESHKFLLRKKAS